MKKDSRYIIILVSIFLVLGVMFLVSALMKKNEPKKKETPPSTEHVIEDSSSEDIPKEDKYERWRKEALATLETQTPAGDAHTQTEKNDLFVLEVANPDGAKLYFCGNYVMGTTQIEVTSVHGVAEADHAEHGHD